MRDRAAGAEQYVYEDVVRQDILRMIPADGNVIGSIGCGWAATEAELVKRGRTVHGVDVSPRAVETAAKRLSSARRIDPGEREPFAPDSLDGLILADIIEHLPAAWEALRSYVRSVRPGGWVAISTPNMRNLKVLAQFLVRGDWPEEPTGIFDATHVQVMSKKRLQRWCTGAGLVVEEWFDVYLSRGVKRGVLRAVDVGSARLLRFWLTSQLQVRCRKPGSTTQGAPLPRHD